MHTQEEELKSTIEKAQAELNMLMHSRQRDDAKQGRLDAIEAASVQVERNKREVTSLERKIEDAAIKLDEEIKARFDSRIPHAALGVGTPVYNRAADWIGLKDGLLSKLDEQAKFVARHAELFRIEQRLTPQD